MWSRRFFFPSSLASTAPTSASSGVEFIICYVLEDSCWEHLLCIYLTEEFLRHRKEGIGEEKHVGKMAVSKKFEHRARRGSVSGGEMHRSIGGRILPCSFSINQS